MNLLAAQSLYFHLLQPKSITPNNFFFFENWIAQIVKQIDFKNSNTYSIVTILHVKQQLFKHIFKFPITNSSWTTHGHRILAESSP